MTRIGKPLLGLLTLAIASTLFAQGQSPITYIYDELGRLVAVVDPSGDTATYTYDAVGNILSIGRHSSAQVSIVEFSPHSGPVGSAVKVYGTGFSTTPSQNTVKFNGVTATVTASTATQITTSVPAGATSGTIQVIAPGGTATSSASFTVTLTNGLPTISSFTPTIGTAGTAVTISGTNFETTTSYDKSRFNITLSTVTSATATSIATSVPAAATSGRISVTTRMGKGTSSADFFVPPSPYTPVDVLVTTRMSLGGSTTVSIGTANKVGMVLFDGNAAQRISLKTINSTIASYNISIINPDGTSLVSALLTTGSGFIDTKLLPATGTYTILIDPNSTYTGSTTLNLYEVPADLTGTITPGGSAVTQSFGTPGQNGKLTFSGTSNQRISLKATNATLTSYNVSIINPDGTTLVTPTLFPAGSAFIDTRVLPATGTYSIVVDPNSYYIGDSTLTLYNVPADTTGSISPGGSAVTVTLATPGQNGTLTFSGTTDQRISLKTTNATIAAYNVSITNPDGSALVSPTLLTSGSGFIDTKTLPATGTFTISIDPTSFNTGATTLTLYNVPADTTGSISPGGSAVTVTLATPGQNGTLTFSGTTNQRISLKTTNATIAAYNVSITNPNGSVLVSPTLLTSGSGFIDTKTLPATGTFTISIDPTSFNTGATTLTLYNVPADVTGALTINGAQIAVTITTPGQNGTLTFAGNSGQQVTVRLTSNTIPGVTVKLIKSDGTVLTSLFSTASSFNLSQQTLPTTGTYSVSVDPSGANTGSINVKVTSP